MGGLRSELPLAFWAFVIGGSALSGLPLLTAGFFSKDLIIWQAWAGPNGNGWFWIAGISGATLTSFYTYRMILLVFYGPATSRSQNPHERFGVSHPSGHTMLPVNCRWLCGYATAFRW